MRYLRMVYPALALMAATPALSAPATSPVSDVPPASCETQATTVEMVECADWHFAVADRWLNQEFKATVSALEPTPKEKLREAQKAWLKFRDAQCAAERDAAEGGTMASILEIDCRAALTQERARTLSGGGELATESAVLIYEKPSASVLGAFKCDGRILQARIGLIPQTPPEGEQVRAFLTVDDSQLEWPIGAKRQDAVCSADLTLSVTADPQKSGCPMIKVDDGLCDSIRVRWNPAADTFEWSRN